MSDLIKRSDAIEALRLEYPMMPLFKAMREEWALRTEGFRRAEEVIMRLPSAERKGEWIDNGDRYFRCSLCGTKDTDKWHWCHGCGHPMKGAEDE